MQRSAIFAACDLGLGRAGGLERVVAEQRIEGVPFRIQRLDAGERPTHEFYRGDLLAFDRVGNGGQRGEGQFLGRGVHRGPPLRSIA